MQIPIPILMAHKHPPRLDFKGRSSLRGSVTVEFQRNSNGLAPVPTTKSMPKTHHGGLEQQISTSPTGA